MNIQSSIQTGKSTRSKRIPFREAISTIREPMEVRDTLILGAFGATPVLGACTQLPHFLGNGWGSEMKGPIPLLGLSGSALNLGGTVLGTIGLWTGNTSALWAGVGMLGASGLTAGLLVAGSR